MAIPSYHAVVIETTPITRRMQRVTVGGPGLRGFDSRDLPDERIKLLLAPPGEQRPVLPEIDERGFHWPPGAPRPLTRTFTVRRFDPGSVELDIDIALHDGPAAAWALRAEPGDELGVSGPTGGYEPAASDARHVLIGDEAALPAVATILERLPASARADVLVETRDADGELALDSLADARVTWLHRNGNAPGARLVEAVREYGWGGEDVQVWAAGEALAMRAIRRHLRDQLHLPRERFHVVGYWRDRLSEDQTIDAHLAAQEAARLAGASEDEIDDVGLY
jgi:NADPH-dependent ferric siderophore reductase